MPRKSVISKPWKKRAIVTSSSSSSSDEEEVPMQQDVGFDPTTFVDLEASNRYKRFASLKIKTGSKVIFDDLEEFDIRPLFEYQGWIPFMILFRKTYARLVREFYANLGSSADEPTQLTSMVDGNEILVTPEILAYTLNVPNVGVDIFNLDLTTFTEYPQGKDRRNAARRLHGAGKEHLYHDLSMNTLLDRPRVLVNLLSHTVIPKTGSRHKYTGTHKLLAYCLLAGIKVNLPVLLIKYMWDISCGGKNLYYGKVLTRIFEECDFDFSSQTDVVKEDVEFGSRNINLMRSMGSLSGHPRASRGESSRGASSQQAPSSSHQPPSQPSSDFQSQVFQRFDELKVQNEDFQSYTDYRFNSLHGQIDYNFSYLYSNLHLNAPPPYQYHPPSTSGQGAGDDDEEDDDDDDEE